MGIELKSTRPMNVTSIDLLPEPLKKVRSQASLLLASMLASMFDNTDDILFELADKAVNNADQTMYFDSMREVRIKREAMETLFIRAVQDNFKLFQRSPVSQSSALNTAQTEESSLSLVQDDELEESVAIRGMISKINNLFGDSLQQLIQRMDSLVEHVTIDVENNPLGPTKLSEAFQVASQPLSLDIRARLVVFKLFEKFVLSELEGFYRSANQSLIASGVLPQIAAPKTAKPASSSSSRDAARKSGSEQNEPSIVEADQNNEVFSLLRDLLANKSQQPSSEHTYLPVSDSGPTLSPTELVDMLSTVQQQRGAANESAGQQSTQIDVRHALQNLLSSRAAGTPQAVGRVDDDAINLVSMLFEFILDDHSLPVSMKALLARLQIPMLKVALLDKTFFSRGAHPARKLLNELAKAALSWNEPADIERDVLYKKISAVITSVLNDFESDVGIFTPLLADFEQFVSGERRKSDLIEQRTRDAEEGLGKSQRARADVGKLLNDKATGKQLPDAVVELLREGWSNYLFLLYVKQGTQDEAWLEAVQVVDDLIWSVDKDANFGHRSDLLKMIPLLLKRLREGLNAISFSKNRMRELFSQLEDIHMICLRSREVDAEQVEPEVIVAEPDVSRDQAIPEVAEVAPIILEAPVLEPLDVDEPDAAVDDDEFVAMVDSMAVGAWVEFVDGEDKTSRCKLAAIIRASGKYIFVNRVGIKVAEYTRSKLIIAAQKRVITMLDNALLFDRALESVIGHLREMKD